MRWVGRAASARWAGQDEKEQTLNQLLAEMDGFDRSVAIVILAATNRPEILDPALLRAGRFDRQVLVDRPDKKGRVDILRIHLANLKLAADVKLEEIAALTPGFTGADLANLGNEAAVLATRRGAESIAEGDFTGAVERIIAGLEKKSRILIPRERRIVAYHEMGHALVALAIPGSDPVQKVSIIPRGIGALGYTLQRPTDDRFLMGRQELEDKMAVLMGGRAAETLLGEDISTGAADDLAKATDIARGMVLRFGMDDRSWGRWRGIPSRGSSSTSLGCSGSRGGSPTRRRTRSTWRCVRGWRGHWRGRWAFCGRTVRRWTRARLRCWRTSRWRRRNCRR